MKLTTEKLKGNTFVLHLSGHIGDGENEPGSADLFDSLKKEAKDLLVDFRSVSSLNTSGIRFLLHLNRIMREKEGAMVLYNITDSIFQILQVAGFDHLLQTCKTQEEALTLLRQGGK